MAEIVSVITGLGISSPNPHPGVDGLQRDSVRVTTPATWSAALMGQLYDSDVLGNGR